MKNDMHFVDVNTAFMKCFDTDKEREQYMYMGSKGSVHYFKHIDSRQYKTVSILI